MQSAIRLMLGLAIVMATLVVARAVEKKPPAKEVTLKGELACGKCVFEVEGLKKCTNAIKVKEGGKDVVYILIDKGPGEPYHKGICKATKKGSVTGVVSKKDGQNYIKPSKDGVKFD